jgi:hypothetical protein
VAARVAEVGGEPFLINCWLFLLYGCKLGVIAGLVKHCCHGVPLSWLGLALASGDL